MAFIVSTEESAEKAGWSLPRRRQIETALKRFLVIPYHEQIARHFGVIKAGRERLGRPIAHGDAWIAACAFASAPLLYCTKEVARRKLLAERPEKNRAVPPVGRMCDEPAT